MYSFLAKKGQGLAVALGVIVSAIFLGSVFGGLGSAGFSVSDDLNEIMKNNPDQSFDFFNPGIAITIALIAIAAIVAVLFGLFQMFSAPKNSMKMIIAVAAIAAIFFALYSSSSSDLDAASPIYKTLMEFEVGENVSKLISGGIKTTVILGAISALSMIVMEVYNIFK